MHLSRDQFAAWLERYIEAWRSNDPADIGDLFSEDVIYSQSGGHTAIEGREAVVKDWLEEAYAPGESWEASYEPLAIEGQVHVAVGSTRYLRDSGERDEYSNVFICRFDEDGRCHDLKEWYMKAPSPVTRLG
jgi:ketosteroid isomerase-like protein